MDRQRLYYRRRFNIALEPIKVMLVNKKRTLSLVRWLSFVNSTKHSVLSHPDQYLGDELPEREVLEPIVGTIFSEFLRDQA
jgi:hypothetical protein